MTYSAVDIHFWWWRVDESSHFLGMAMPTNFKGSPTGIYGRFAVYIAGVITFESPYFIGVRD